MNRKENKGGQLNNQQVEAELERTGADNSKGYRGSQDTGDEVVRTLGTEVQQQDGAGIEDQQDTRE